MHAPDWASRSRRRCAPTSAPRCVATSSLATSACPRRRRSASRSTPSTRARVARSPTGNLHGRSAVARKGGLGRGLTALIPAAESESQEGESGYREIPIGAVQPNPLQPRRLFDEETLEGLIDSVKEL